MVAGAAPPGESRLSGVNGDREWEPRIAVGEDAIGSLHDFADQEGDARPEIPESVDTEVARPVPVEEFADASP